MYKIIGFIALMWPVICFAGEMTDPTKPSAYSIEAGTATEKEAGPVETTWVLNSILISPQRKVAVINGKQVIEGGKIDQYLVKKIDTYQVTLTDDLDEQVLTLGSYRLEKKYLQSDIGATNE